jgi:phage repressor protein C with HTH and peptisase S24 domain
MENSNMESLIRRGAFVGLDRENTKIISGEIFGLVLPYEGLVVRRLYLEPEAGVLVLSSDSEAHADKRVPLDEYVDKVVGRVSWVMQTL